jgi:DNA-binding response OmpR family regulator
MEASGEGRNGGLVMLVDDDVESRRHVRHLLERRGMEVVQASNAIAALGLIQRLPDSFRLVVTDLDLPGVSGAVLVGTLRLFRPDIQVLCINGSPSGAGLPAVGGCLVKPLQDSELDVALEAVLRGGTNEWEPRFTDGLLSPSATARARARFAVALDLVEAALELERAPERGV